MPVACLGGKPLPLGTVVMKEAQTAFQFVSPVQPGRILQVNAFAVQFNSSERQTVSFNCLSHPRGQPQEYLEEHLSEAAGEDRHCRRSESLSGMLNKTVGRLLA